MSTEFLLFYFCCFAVIFIVDFRRYVEPSYSKLYKQLRMYCQKSTLSVVIPLHTFAVQHNIMLFLSFNLFDDISVLKSYTLFQYLLMHLFDMSCDLHYIKATLAYNGMKFTTTLQCYCVHRMGLNIVRVCFPIRHKNKCVYEPYLTSIRPSICVQHVFTINRHLIIYFPDFNCITTIVTLQILYNTQPF